ncbi:MAG: ferredoxin [Anaerolineaceae bacterium]|nr:ferredoxin [Anaerolineaceae bacterium]
MKVSINEDLCIGCGVCESVAEGIFSLENGATAEVLVKDVPKKKEAEVKQASLDCPVEAIVIEAHECHAAPEKESHEKAAGQKPADKKTKEKGKEMKVTVDKDLCIGCGVCEGICPEVFSLANEPYAEVLLDPIPAEFQELCKQSATDCPAEAIKIEE